MNNTHTHRLIKMIGREKIASALNIKAASVTSWYQYGVPPKHCLALEKLSNGEVTAHDLRPDIFKQPSA